MTTNRTSGHRRRSKVAQGLRGIALLFMLAALGYIAVAVAEHARPLLNAAASFALESQMANPETVGTTVDAQPTMAGTASAAVAPRDTSAEHFDYYPDHYVNKATAAEEQPPTF